MNKALRVLTYVFLALTGAALFFEIQLNARRAELTKRSKVLEEYIVKIARTVEKAEADKSVTFEVAMDSSPVEAKVLDDPEMTNLLADYPGSLEAKNLETFEFGERDRHQLQTPYRLDPDGKPEMEGGEYIAEGPGTSAELMNKLFEACKNQKTHLDDTRTALTDLRGKLEAAVAELNKAKADARQAKSAQEEQKERLAQLESERSGFENQITKQKSQIEELNAEITSLKDEVQTAKDETDVAKDENGKQQKLIDQLKKLLKDALMTTPKGDASAVAVTTLPAGDKGKIVRVDNEDMFAVVELSNEAMKELKGEDLRAAVPQVEFAVRRTGFHGEAGEFVGRLRVRQEVKGSNLMICDVLGSWEQAKAQVNDIVFAD
ncbi:MAG: hypothetical protein K6G91_10340 [Kiritimatiellae bacterium]|nr:hypothetical protein [Kiritimatiellia bacterium]